MIFAAVGSQKFQFNRLLRELDSLVENGDIPEKLFVQTGWSDYVPQNYGFEKFVGKEEFERLIDQAEIVIAHGGIGTVMAAIKVGKPVIIYPRLKKYNEHVDDHQLEAARALADENYALCCCEGDNLADLIIKSRTHKFKKYSSSDVLLVKEIEAYIQSEMFGKKPR